MLDLSFKDQSSYSQTNVTWIWLSR